MEKGIEFKGLSGCELLLDGNVLIKRSRNSRPDLLYSFKRQMDHYLDGGLSPLKVARPIRYIEGEVDEFHMEYIPSKSLQEVDLNGVVAMKIIKFFERQMVGYSGGFKEKIINVLAGFHDGPYKREILKLLSECSDEMVTGLYCHGDLGLANIIQYGCDAYLIDFTRPLVKTVLTDIACLKGTTHLFPSEAKLEMLDSILETYKRFDKQIEILKKLRAAQFYHPGKSEDGLKALEEWCRA